MSAKKTDLTLRDATEVDGHGWHLADTCEGTHLRRRLFIAYGEKARLTVSAVGERTRAEWQVPVSGPLSEDST